jgi:aldehyde dehydrogenase (NAD+)
MKTYQYFCDGQWRDPSSGLWFESDNPTRGAPWARIPRCNAEDVEAAVQAAHRCFSTGAWSRTNAAGRGRLLRRMGDVVVRHAEQLGAIETTDNGKRRSDIVEPLKTWLADSFYYYAGLADKVEGAVIPVDAPDLLNYTRREPYGVCACITAWNSPLLIAIWKMAPALAAGNTLVLKPSEHASASTLALMEVLAEADLPPGLVNVVTGFGPEAGAALVDHPLVRLLSFTGGFTGGSHVAAAAGRQAKPVIMELGGKSPQIVFRDADLELAVHGVASGIFPPSGQSCISGSRAIVHRSLYDQFVRSLCEVAGRARLGDPADPMTQVPPIANRSHFDRVLQAIETAKKEGAHCVLGGVPTHLPELGGWFIGPTVFTNVTPQMQIMREEIFGPVIAVLPFDDDEEAIRLANDTDYGLAAGLWTADTARAIGFADRIQAGTVYINNYYNATTQSPVGGFKRSGYGRENGLEGMLAYLQTKSIWVSTAPHQPNPFP